MKKTMVQAILCGALFALILSCGSTGGGKPAEDRGPPVPATGEWSTFGDWENNGGSSSITQTEVEIDGMVAYHYAGEITSKFVYGFAGINFEPSPETLEALKTASAISFMVKGDGARYAAKILMPSTQSDGCHYESVFITDDGEAKLVHIPVKAFTQPSWGNYRRFAQDTLEALQWQTTNNGKPGTFELTVWDLQVYP